MTTAKKKTKKQQILEYMQKGWKISSMDAFRLFRATRLAAVIHDLRKDHIINSEVKRGEDGAYYSVYKYVKEREDVLGA